MQEIINEKIEIKNLIYEIRGKQVMLDSDLAYLYGCKNGTKDINKAVKRNIERFPKDFYFKLTKEENEKLRFQIGTAKSRNMSRTLPYVFTEQGVAMLSSVLKTERATKVSVAIMRAFVQMRHFIIDNKDMFNRLTKVEYEVLNLNDRFIILDDKELYHIGASLKDLGKKCFAINKMEEEYIGTILERHEG